MRSRILVLAVVGVGILGCPTREKYDQLPTVRITSPVVETYTNKTVRITAQLDQEVDLPVALWANQLYLGTVRPPDYRLDWDTTAVPEAPYEVVAELEIAGRTVRSDTVRVVVDRTPPTVVSRTTLQHEGGVKLSAPIKVLFSEPMDAASITSQAISFEANGANVPITVALGTDNKTVSIAIKDRSTLTLPASFEGTFSSGITDLAGNALVLPTAPWTWSAPAVFSYPLSANRPWSVPALAIGPDLEPSVVYAGGGPIGSSWELAYVINVHMAGGPQKWIQLPPPTTREFDSQPSPNIVVDDQGHPIVTWQEDGDLRVAYWDGEAWMTPLPPLDGDGKPSTPVLNGTRLALGRDGELFVAWSEDVGSGTDIYVARATAGAWDKSFGSIGLPVVVGTAYLADLVVDDDGSVRVGWSGSESAGGISVWQGSAWNTITPIGAVSRISASKDETGSSLALQGRPALSLVRLIDNEWQPVFLALPTEYFLFPSLGIGPDHKPSVAWINADNLLSLARWRGNTWDLRAAAAIPDSPGGMGDTLMTLDSQGNMWVKWIHYPQVQIFMSNY
jgi:hypothetical protein